MLSVVDLLDAGTMPADLAAYALAAIGKGASFLVGARPGGAGKTTVMGALLNFVPEDVTLLPADGAAAVERGPQATNPRRCYICHEIGAGPYYAYLWGRELRAYFDLPTAGHMLATNLHADTIEQARDQVCNDNGVPGGAFRRMNLLFFLSVRRGLRGARRRIEAVWSSDGSAEHGQVFTAESGLDLNKDGLVGSGDLAAAQERLAGLLASGARTIEDVRTFLISEEVRWRGGLVRRSLGEDGRPFGADSHG